MLQIENKTKRIIMIKQDFWRRFFKKKCKRNLKNKYKLNSDFMILCSLQKRIN